MAKKTKRIDISDWLFTKEEKDDIVKTVNEALPRLEKLPKNASMKEILEAFTGQKIEPMTKEEAEKAQKEADEYLNSLPPFDPHDCIGYVCWNCGSEGKNRALCEKCGAEL